MRLSESTVAALGRLATTRDQAREVAATLHRQVIEARGAGASWDSIGSMLGCSGEAARKTHGPKMPARVRQPDALF